MLQENKYDTEIYLWRKFLGGNEKAFDELYGLYFPKLFVYGNQITKNQELLRDCIQLLFIEFWQKRKKIKKIKRFRQYLFKSYRRKVIKHLKKDAKIVPLEASLIDDYNNDVELPFEEIIINHQNENLLKEYLKPAFKDLTARQKEAIYFRFFENMTYQEIAEAMDFKNAKYARTIIYRAIENLRKKLHDNCPSY